MKRGSFLLVFGIVVNVGYSQIRQPQTPQFPNMQPVMQTPQPAAMPHYDNAIVPSPNSNGKVVMGATAQDVINRSNRQGNPAIYAAVSQKQQEIDKLMKEVEAARRRLTATNNGGPMNYWTPNPERTKDFPAALTRLEDMLLGKTKLSVADAYYTVEAAYGDPYLTRQQYNNVIKESAAFIKAWMVENKLSVRDNYQTHYAIRKFMSETLTVNKTVRNNDNSTNLDVVSHAPFGYDYNDYSGEKDYRSLFLTKCLATGFGQCASMPAVYLVLAEALGVKAYLSFAPYHSFVKYPDNSGYILNYEPTSNWEISDKWYMDNMFISPEAVASGIYLDTLNSKQVVANCAFDLAVEYIKVDLTGKEDLILNALRIGTPYFPKNNNLPSLFIYSMHLKTMLREAMRRNRITSFDDIEKNPEAQQYYKEYLDNEAYIAKLGYRDVPAGMYEEMLNQQEFKGKVQQQLNINGKEKRTLFTKTGR
ncbi:MAG: hypothetical protein SFW35_05150 [Chitinophagales bacterium]|nr:hypothetical protein [Chitinophagales bacterium]